MHATLRKATLGFFLGLQLISAVALAQSIGKIEFAVGIVRIERGSQTLAGLAGTPVAEGDVIVTGPETQVQLRMADDAFLALRPNTRLTLDKYRFNQSREKDDVVLSLAHGVMRAFTGAIATQNRERFLMKTPLATVGIRGSGNILAHLGDEGTVNHTITGAHSVTALDDVGKLVTVVTRPGQTVQVRPGAAPRFIATPSFIFAAASSAPPTQLASASTSSSTSSTSSGGSSTAGGGGDNSSSDTSRTGGGGDSSSSSSSGGSSSSADPSRASGGGDTASGSSSSTSTSLPGGTGTTTGSSSSPSSNVQTAAAPSNVRASGGVTGSGLGGGLSVAIAGNLVNPNGGRAGLFASDNDPGYTGVTLDSSGVLTGATYLNYSHPPGAAFPTFPGASFTDATVRITGTPSDYFRNIEQNIILGRLQGATIDVTGVDCSCGSTESRTDTTGIGAAVFVAYNESPRGVVLSYTGATDFRLDGSTRPADSLGNVGTLNSASMHANFTDRTLDFTFSLSVNSLTYTTTASAVSFDGVRFGVGNADGSPTALAINCAGSGCAPSYRAAVNGSFAGNATTAWMVYHIFPADYSDLVNGAIAFSAVTTPLPRFTLPATGTWTMVMVDNFIGTGPGFPTFNTSAGAHINFTTRRADFTMTLDRVLTPVDIQAGFQAQSVTASGANLPMQGVGFVAQTASATHPSTLTVTCTGCGTAPPVGRFEGYLSYVDPSATGGNVNLYWYLTNNTSGTLGYDYNGSTYFGNAPNPTLAGTTTTAGLAPGTRLATLPDVIRGPIRRPR